ncbi:MAG: hypothetical protein JWP66_792 [Naasia sp.]|nr:hypothetical protein [Naasia sp.]
MRPPVLPLEREIDRITAAWITDLAGWHLPAPSAERTVCVACRRAAEELQLDELPHDALHALVGAISRTLWEHSASGYATGLAYARVLERHADIAFAQRAYIEPRIRSYADDLTGDIDAC